jgi:predicted nucleic acid-binding protein
MKVYLDNCCYNRPYDDQSNIVNRLETEAKLFIQDNIRKNNLDLVWSSVNDFENNANISPEKIERIADWKYIASERCILDEAILEKALELEQIGLRAKDALHVASAISTKCDFFITTDKKILNKNVKDIRLINPINFVEENFDEK